MMSVTITTQRLPSVHVVADHAMALEDAVASLRGSATIRQAPSDAADVRDVDVIVVEQTLSAPDADRLARLAESARGAAILSVVARGAGQYSWLRARSVGTLFRIEATGRGNLADAVREAAAATPD